jgi:hypothetical protein
VVLVGPHELLRPNRTKPLQNFLSPSSSSAPPPADLAREERAPARAWPEQQQPPPWRPGSRPGRPRRGGPRPGAAPGCRWCGPRYPSRRARRRTRCRSPRRSSTPPRYRPLRFLRFAASLALSAEFPFVWESLVAY